MASRKSVIVTPWEGVPEDISGFYGFVYEIIHVDSDRKYIGRKYFWSKRSKKVKGKTRRIHSVLESDWKTYKSSCQEILDIIKVEGISPFRFFMLECLEKRVEVNYRELELQIQKDVLRSKLPSGEYEYFNGNILNRYYKGNFVV